MHGAGGGRRCACARPDDGPAAVLAPSLGADAHAGICVGRVASRRSAYADRAVGIPDRCTPWSAPERSPTDSWTLSLANCSSS